MNYNMNNMITDMVIIESVLHKVAAFCGHSRKRTQVPNLHLSLFPLTPSVCYGLS